uniref:WD_REPEATS_REGION domain-containing protein n=1 Tax=Parastrongyloides trichosuri TaxID=131310 RepID=A0A0N4ZT99_PARTI
MSDKKLLNIAKNESWETLYYNHNSTIKPLLFKVEIYGNNMEKICFIDEDKNLVTMSNDLEILKIESLFHQTNVSNKITSFVSDLNAFDKVNEIIALVNKSFEILLINSMEKSYEFINFPSTIYSCLLVQDKTYNRFALLAGSNNKIYLYDIPSKRILSTFKCSNSGVISNFIYIGGCLFLSISLKKNIELWDLRRSEEPLKIFDRLIPHMTSSINSVDVDKYSLTGIFLLQGSKDGSYKVSNIHTGAKIKIGKLKNISKNNMKSIKFFCKEQEFALSLIEESNELYLINLKTCEEKLIMPIQCQKKAVLHFLGVLPGSQKLIFVENNRLIMMKFCNN